MNDVFNFWKSTSQLDLTQLTVILDCAQSSICSKICNNSNINHFRNNYNSNQPLEWDNHFDAPTFNHSSQRGLRNSFFSFFPNKYMSLIKYLLPGHQEPNDRAYQWTILNCRLAAATWISCQRGSAVLLQLNHDHFYLSILIQLPNFNRYFVTTHTLPINDVTLVKLTHYQRAIKLTDLKKKMKMKIQSCWNWRGRWWYRWREGFFFHSIKPLPFPPHPPTHCMIYPTIPLLSSVPFLHTHT